MKRPEQTVDSQAPRLQERLGRKEPVNDPWIVGGQEGSELPIHHFREGAHVFEQGAITARESALFRNDLHARRTIDYAPHQPPSIRKHQRRVIVENGGERGLSVQQGPRRPPQLPKRGGQIVIR